MNKSTISKPTYLSIEGLRGVLALIVCLGHFGFGTMLTPFGLSFNIHYAVDVFFIISGLVLARSNYYPCVPVTGYQFIVKRFARLYPLHILSLALMCFLNFSRAHPISTQSVLENIFLVQNLGLGHSDFSLNYPSWSICVEWWCTLLFFYLTQFFQHRKILVTVLLTYILLQSLFLPHVLMEGAYDTQLNGIFNKGILRGLAGTALGMVIYLTSQHPLAQKAFRSTLVGYLSMAFLALFFLSELPNHLAVFFYFFAFYAIGCLITHPGFFSLLSTRCLVWLGSISYAIYLLHIPLYQALQYYIGDIAVKGLTGKCILLPSLFLLAGTIWIYFERPTQKFFRQYFLVK